LVLLVLSGIGVAGVAGERVSVGVLLAVGVGVFVGTGVGLGVAVSIGDGFGFRLGPLDAERDSCRSELAGKGVAAGRDCELELMSGGEVQGEELLIGGGGVIVVRSPESFSTLVFSIVLFSNRSRR
jgi:hypothetical protein